MWHLGTRFSGDLGGVAGGTVGIHDLRGFFHDSMVMLLPKWLVYNNFILLFGHLGLRSMGILLSFFFSSQGLSQCNPHEDVKYLWNFLHKGKYINPP